jgi:hypothetical protein
MKNDWVPPLIEMMLRSKLTSEEYLAVRAAVENIVNQYRTQQDSRHFLELINCHRNQVHECCAARSKP